MRHLAYACSAAALLLAAAGGAQAQTISDAELATLVRQQAAEIDRLKQRLEALETQSARPATVTTGPAYIPVPAAVATATAEPRETFDWGDGAPQITSADGSRAFRMRGRALADYSTTTGSDFAARNISTTGMRALRLGVEGEMGENFFYQAELDVAEGEGEIKGAFIGWRDTLGDGYSYDIRLGSVLSDRSVEYATGNDTTPFIERSIVSQGLAPQKGVFGLGAMARMFGPNWHASLQLSGDEMTGSGAGHNQRDVFTTTVRGHWNPIKSSTHALHLGAWAMSERFSASQASYTRNTDIGGRWNDNLTVALGALPGMEGAVGGGLELGGYNGPIWAMAEVGQRTLNIRDALGGGEVDTSAWNISAGWFLTGERSHYSAKQGNFGGVRVRNPIDKGGMGGLELLARYEDLDFSEAPLGGTGSAATVGANWYLTDISKLMLNIIQWETDNRAGAYVGEDKGTTVTVRAQVSF